MSNLSYQQLSSRDCYRTRYEPEKGFIPADPPEAALVETDQVIGMGWDGYRLQVTKNPLDMQVSDPVGQAIFALDTEKIAGKLVSASLGFRKKGADEHWPYLSWMIDGLQRYFGFGEKWNKVEKSSAFEKPGSCGNGPGSIS